jgi:hypothetical protein
METPMPTRSLLLWGLLTLALALPSHATAAEPATVAEGFSFKDTPGDHLDVLLGDKLVARYMYAHDNSTTARRDETYKPYLHVFDADGKTPITKGPGGLFPHHRGIFAGWMKITHDGKDYDRWHMKGGEIVHQKFLQEKADKDHATFTSLTHWNDGEGKPIIEEERTTTIRRPSGPGRLVIDFTTRLKAVNGDITLGGDPEHSGVQFRPANELDTAATVYLFPKEGAKPHKDLDYPWVGETFTLHGKQYSVVEMSHPDNPKKTKWSAYRDYGRFGAFPTAEIKSGEALVLRYRFLIADGEMPPVEAIEKSWDEFAGVKEPTAAPKTTVLPAEKSAPTK